MAPSRRSLLAGGAAFFAAFAGCSGLSAPRESQTREFDDANDNDCPDQIETFSVDNSRDEGVTVHITVTREEGGRIYENTFDLSPHSSQSAGEPVFGVEDAQYHIEATHGDITRRETVEGVPCDDRRARFVTVELGQYSTFKIRIETDGDYPP
jgi:hypothetical protein